MMEILHLPSPNPFSTPPYPKPWEANPYGLHLLHNLAIWLLIGLGQW